MLSGIVAVLFLYLFGASTGSATDSTGLCSMFTKVNIPFYDLACRHSENCVENKSIAMSCGEYVLRTNEVFSLEKNKRMHPCGNMFLAVAGFGEKLPA